MKLTNIGMINWHTYGATDLAIEGDITGVIGENGAGKSTLLDAIHVILTGGSEKNINKRAQGSKSNNENTTTAKRSIHSYSLGRLNADTTLRKECATYLLATFEDPYNKKLPVTLIMAFYSSDENSKAHVEARVLIKGAIIKTTDILMKDTAGKTVVPVWTDLRPLLEKKVKESGGEMQSFSQSVSKKTFVQAYMQAMMYRGHYDSYNQFLNNFENAFALKEVKTATDFVQDYVLKDGPIDIGSLRATADTFNKLVDHLAVIKAQILDLEGLITILDKKKENEKIEAIERTLKNMSDSMISRKKNREFINTIITSQANKLTYEKDLAIIDREYNSLMSNIEALKKRKYEMGNESYIQLLKTKIADFRKNIDSQLFLLIGPDGIGKKAYSLRYKLEKLAPNSDILKSFIGLNELVNSTGNAKVEYLPEDTQAADEALKNASHETSVYLPILKEELEDCIANNRALKTECNALQAQIEDIENQRTNREQSLDNFVNTLLKMGVEVDILYEVAEIVDEEWRDAIERLLAGNRDIVLVSEKGYDVALKMQSENQKDFKRITLATTAKLLRHVSRKRENTVATILTSDNPLAEAYIDFSYGNVQLAESRNDFKKDGRWLTKNGLFENGISSKVLENTHPKIGKNGLLNSLPILKQDLETKQLELIDFMKRQNEIGGVHSDLEKFQSLVNTMTNNGTSFSLAKTDIIEKLRHIDTFREDIAAKEDDSDTTMINDEIKTLDEECKELKVKQIDLNNKIKRLEYEIEKSKENLNGSVNLLGSNAHMNSRNQTYRTDKISVSSDFIKVALHELKIRWNTEGGLKDTENALTTLKKKSEAEQKKAAEYLNKTAVDTKTKIGIVLDKLSGWNDLPENYSVNDHLYPWAVNNLNELKNHHIIEYEAQFAKTKKDADDIFKSNFLNGLASKFEEVENQISSLNNIIKNTEFLGEKYKIKKYEAPGREAFHIAVKAHNEINNAVAGGGLLVTTIDEKTTNAMNEIKDLLFSSGEHFDLNEYTDYRKYFTFDLEITNERTGVKNSLESRKATGSGGEIQTPYYICILAAMSNVYYGGPFKNLKKDESGLCLAIFDEAFSNMDEKVTGQVIELGRQLGLQMIICGPSNKKVTMQRNCRTVLTIVKSSDSRNTVIFPEYMQPKVRSELIELDPNLKTDDEIQGLMVNDIIQLQ